MKLRLIDIDGSVMAQRPLKALAAEGKAQVVDARDLCDRMRLWAGRRDITAFARRLMEAGPADGKGAEVFFVGSGDFHHLTAPLLARLSKPVSVVHFDNHPDWTMLPPAYHCGSWVNRALEMEHVKRIVTLGPCVEGKNWPQLKGANLGALTGGKLELHPWSHAPSRVLGRIAGGPHGREGGHIHWKNLAGQDWSGFLDAMIKRLPTDDVWITIDKDVLRHADAVTNWNQGQMPLEAILEAIGKLADKKRIIGVDVCGEFAPPSFPNPLKRLLHVFDQPKPPAFPDLAVNENTNQRLLDTLSAVAV